MHTRIKRKFRLTTGKPHKLRLRKKGAKTFSTEDKARDYAFNVLKLKEGKFNIVPAKRNKRFKIISH